jgi:pullulanase
VIRVGLFWSVRAQVEVPPDFYQYKYAVDFENRTSKKVTDPCAQYSGLSDQNSGVVVGGSRRRTTSSGLSPVAASR